MLAIRRLKTAWENSTSAHPAAVPMHRIVCPRGAAAGISITSSRHELFQLLPTRSSGLVA